MSEKYFLGAMTQQGFSTEFGKLIEDKDYYTYILKGGAGTGKSSLMKKIAAEFEPTEDVVRFYCSSDPNSLDAVVLNGSKVIIVDGTSPHVFDPTYPGACQKIVNLGENWDEERLKLNKDKIIEVTDKNKSMLARAKRFSTALSNVCYDTYFCGMNALLESKLEGFSKRLIKKVLDKKGSGEGRKDIRQLTALTEFGCMTQTDTLENYLDVFYLNDDYFACANLLIEFVADEAVRRGYNVILCPSVAFNNNVFEHLLIPEMGVALVSNSPLTNLSAENCKKINLTRFYDKAKIEKIKARLRLNRLTIKDISEEVYQTIRQAKRIHDDIEKFYITSMNFEKLDEVASRIAFEIQKRN